MRRAGKKTKEWAKIRAKLKVKFKEEYKITACEFNFPGCTYDDFLTFAHSRKRRMILGDEIEEVAIACMSCHRVLDEKMSHEEMYDAVTGVIKNRNYADSIL